MNNVITLVQQTTVMFMLIAVGYLLFKGKKISADGSKAIGNILIFVVLPTVIVKGFMVENTPERCANIYMSALLALVSIVMAMVISRVVFKKDVIASFGTSFSNPGLFGLPLIISVLSEQAVFYVAFFIAFVNVFQFTYGVYLMTNDKNKISLKAILKTPAIIALVLGLIFFVTQIQVPGLVLKAMNYLTALNTPLGMFTVGIYLAQVDLKHMIVRKENYLVCLMRLVVAPLIFLLCLKLVPDTYADLKLAVLIVSACPVGSNIAVYAQLHNQDYGYAVETVIISTLLAIVTIPAIVYLYQIF